MLSHFNDYDFYGTDRFLQFKNPQTFAYFGVRFPTPEQLPAMVAEMERRFRYVLSVFFKAAAVFGSFQS
jgi:hypothetical protein